MVRTRWLLALALAGCGFRPAARTSDGGARDTASTADTGPDGLPATCTPGATACVGRVVRTCGANGAWDPTQDQTCEFTCAAGACVAASNIPGANIAGCDSTAPRLAPAAGATVLLTAANGVHLSCSPDCGDPGVTSIEPVATLQQPNGAPDLDWFCLSELDLPAGVKLGLPATGGPSQAIALVVDGTATIDGEISFDGLAATSAVPGGAGAPGGYDGADLSSSAGSPGKGPCGGAGGGHDGSSDHWVGGGGAGAGYATGGAGGGTGRCSNNGHTGTGARAGGSCGSPALSPLVGGSGGGGGGDATTNVQKGWAGGGGGGALQIAARLGISIAGTVHARGGAGYGEASIDGGGGGGAGGAILLEAPTIAVSGTVVVDGGNGGSSGAGAGGKGATSTSAPGTGATFANPGQGGSGGGGAGGRIRLEAVGATCTPAESPAASCSAAALAPQS